MPGSGHSWNPKSAAPSLFSSTTLPPNGRELLRRHQPRAGDWGQPQEQSRGQHSDGPCQPQPPVKEKLCLPLHQPLKWFQHLQKLGVLSAPCSGPCPASLLQLLLQQGSAGKEQRVWEPWSPALHPTLLLTGKYSSLIQSDPLSATGELVPSQSEAVAS